MVGGFAAALRDLVDGLAKLLLAARREEDPGARVGQRDREGASESGRRSRDQRDLTLQRLIGHELPRTAKSATAGRRRKCIIRSLMDTISHGIAGAVFGRSLTDRPGARAALIVGAAAAMLPDLDFLFISTRLDYLRDHRGWTHSFLVMPFLALAVALVAKLFAKTARLATLWLFAAVGITSHIVFDWMTSFGTMFWTPLSRSRYSLDWLFILDPYFTGIVLLTLVFTLVDRPRGRRIAVAGEVLLGTYIAFCAVLHAHALAVWRRLDAPPPSAKVAVLPQFLSPFRWLGVSERENSVHAAFFDVGPFASGRDDPKPPEALDRDSRESPGLLSSARASAHPAVRTAGRLSGAGGGARAAGLRGLPRVRPVSARDGFRIRTGRQRGRRPGPAIPALVHGSLASVAASTGSGASPSSTVCASMPPYASSSAASSRRAGVSGFGSRGGRRVGGGLADVRRSRDVGILRRRRSRERLGDARRSSRS